MVVSPNIHLKMSVRSSRLNISVFIKGFTGLGTARRVPAVLSLKHQQMWHGVGKHEVLWK